MTAPRSTTAIPMPASTTRPWSWAGTWDRLIRMTKTSRLSSERLYSVSQPAKNCPAGVLPEVAASRAPNPTASSTVTSVQPAASDMRTGRLRRALASRSAPSNMARPATTAAQPQTGT